MRGPDSFRQSRSQSGPPRPKACDSVFSGDHIYDVDLKKSPHEATNERPLSLIKKVDAAMCDPHGVRVIVGNHFYHFNSLELFVAGRSIPEQHRVSMDLFGCDH